MYILAIVNISFYKPPIIWHSPRHLTQTKTVIAITKQMVTLQRHGSNRAIRNLRSLLTYQS